MSALTKASVRGGLSGATRSQRERARCNSRRHSVARAGKRATPAPVEEDIPSYFIDTVDGASEASGDVDQPTAVSVRSGPPAVERQAPPPTSFWSSVPPLVWIGVGVLLGNVVGTALEFVKGGPQKMQEMAMQQMMKQMMKQAGGAPGANPFGGPGGMGGFPPMPGMPGMPGAPGAPGAPEASPFGAGIGGFPPTPPAQGAGSASPIDTTASAAAPVEEKKGGSVRETVTPSEVKEGTQASSTRKKSAFVDVDVKEAAATGGANSTGSENKGFFGDNTAAEGESEAKQNVTEEAKGAGASPPPPPPTDGAFSSSMLDMLKDENMQKMLYPYLPEPMRNPQTFEWMLNDPTMRKQLEEMMQGQMAGGGAAAPNAVQDLMRDADMSPEKMQEQFNQMGMDPSEMVGKIMQDPELAQLMTKPSVLSAIAECSKDPMAIMKYSSDKEVMTVFEKMSQMFPGAAGGMPPGGGFPGMPPQ